jgi:hypothetical protein
MSNHDGGFQAAGFGRAFAKAEGARKIAGLIGD